VSDTPTPDYAASLDFLRRFHIASRWTLTAITTCKKFVTTDTFDAGREAECRAWLEAHGASKNVYFSVGDVAYDVKKKAERTDIHATRWLHVDVDPRAGEDIAQERERALGLLRNPPGLPPPTCIVFSGGGYQAFWQLREPILIDRDLARAEDAKLYNLQIEVLLGADNVHDISRIMRLPGTVNRPDALKAKKGRKPALAALVEWDDGRTYDLGQFAKAQQVQTGETGLVSPARSVRVSSNVPRLNSVDELEGVSGPAKIVICQGFNPDDPNRFPGRSEWLFYACCEMVRAGVDDDTIYSVITDPQFGISDSVLDKGSMTEKYALRQIERAREDAIDP